MFRQVPSVHYATFIATAFHPWVSSSAYRKELSTETSFSASINSRWPDNALGVASSRSCTVKRQGVSEGIGCFARWHRGAERERDKERKKNKESHDTVSCYLISARVTAPAPALSFRFLGERSPWTLAGPTRPRGSTLAKRARARHENYEFPNVSSDQVRSVPDAFSSRD